MKIIRCLFLFIFVLQSHAQISDFETIDFKKADRIALEYKNERLDKLPELVHKLTSNLTTDVERFRAIFTWVCNNIANDYGMYSKNMRKRQRFKNDSVKLENWNTEFRKATLKKLLKNNRTICTGYAYLLKELANLANIECEMVHGFAKTSTINIESLDMPNHTWNAVRLNGKWYLCDPTWASGIPNPETFQFQFLYNDGFFLANPKLFVIDHFPVDEKWLLLDDINTSSFETFIESPIIYGQAYANLSNHIQPKKMHNTIQKNEKITFKFQLLKPANAKDVTLLIDSGNNSKTIRPESTVVKNESLTFEYKFKYTGFYDVHFLLGDDLISTYTFKVKS
ncbi:transglutaminase domain-containing protein [Hwangdonia lutea]|uniref:Transglutaminase domain-containing protein n=1 Tax=Hwangdonia lutea TaxID=3075823 RepID=A0AA97EMZ1_9FLAO|nr:transglutaminase domain-containing protein [Hwangdonia sp. SCSIO 19198]WOD44307.1 transglutaminase domain-containing protein [Hwangdonia sp. SCSIO 19198]